MNPRGHDRVETTDQLRAAAVEELIAVGQADFAMEGVAKRAFFSIGAIYNRWPDRDALLADVATVCIGPELAAGLDRQTSALESIDWLMGPGQRECLLVGELLLAARSSPLLVDPAQQLWQVLRALLGRVMPEGMSWYVATYAVGNALLGAIGVRGPNPATGRSRWLADACEVQAPESREPRPTRPPGDVDVPVVPSPQRSDEVARALIGAAQVLLAEHGAEGVSTRDIAAGAGVTTGALYRRYAGKSGLLADVLLAQLQPDRYTWTWDLVRALASDTPLSNAAAVLAERTIVVASDEQAQTVLLQLGVAARNDEDLQSQVAERVATAHRARTDLAQHFASVDLLREDVDPAAFAWGFQAIPVGIRATQAAGIALDAAAVGASMEALLRSAAAPAQGHEFVV